MRREGRGTERRQGVLSVLRRVSVPSPTLDVGPFPLLFEDLMTPEHHSSGL